jgi:ElaB/YqjD/DUF883 family membrane-anchored ribosome-binding protein
MGCRHHAFQRKFAWENLEETVMANGTGSLERDYATIQKDIASLRDDVASLTDTLKDVSARQAAGVADALRHGLDGAAGRVKDASKRVRAGAQEAADTLQANVEEHPFSSVLLALGLGVVVGMLMRR